MENLSAFEYHAIETMASFDAERDTLMAQLSAAQCIARDYTGVGLYVTLCVPATMPRLDPARWQIQDLPMGHAEHPALPAGAGLILWSKDGFLHCLECYALDGDWPADESLLRVVREPYVITPPTFWGRLWRRLRH